MDDPGDPRGTCRRLLPASELVAMLLVVYLGVYPSLLSLLAPACLPGIPMAAWGLWRPAALRRRRWMRIYVHACGAAALLAIVALAAWIIAIRSGAGGGPG